MGVAFHVPRIRSAALRALNYAPEVEALRSRSRRPTIALHELTQRIGPAYATVFKRLDCAPDFGVELLSQSDMFAFEPKGRFIRRDSMAGPDRYEIKRWQILLAGAGTLGQTELYGRAVLSDSRLAGKYVGQDAATLEFREPGGDLNLFVFAFLSSRIGTRAVRSTSYGTKILRFRLDLLQDLLLPLPDASMIRDVADLIRVTAACRETYAERIRQARAAIDSLPAAQQAFAVSGERKRRCVAWNQDLPTLGAWNFASAGSALAVLRREWSGRFRDVLEADGLFNGPRFARIPCEPPHGIDFMSQRDAFLVRPVPRRIVHPGFANRLLFAPEGSILVGGRGTLGEGEIFGRTALVSSLLSRIGASEDFLRIQSKSAFREIAYAFLSTELGFRLLRTTAVGTKILKMRPDLLLDLPFPDVPDDVAKEVRDAVSAAQSARAKADAAEAEAIRIVEEEVLPQWLA